MTKILFIPFKVVAGILSGIVGRKAFERIWGVFGDKRIPDPDQPQASVARLAGSLVLQGAIFSAARGLIDHGSRRYFNKLTGRWPGKKPDEEPETEV